MIVHLGDGFAGPVLENIAGYEVLKVAPDVFSTVVNHRSFPCIIWVISGTVQVAYAR